MRRVDGESDAFDDLGRTLHERSQSLIREGRIEDFVKHIHPLEIAKFKSFYLLLNDAATSDLVARGVLVKFDAHLSRKAIVEADGPDVAAAYLRICIEST